MSKDDEKQNMGLTYDIASLYEKGYSMTRMKKEMKLHQETIKRGLGKALDISVNITNLQKRK